jgi:hypothetical protein
MVRMPSFMRTFRLSTSVCLVLAGLTLASLTAWAYIPPASFILHEVAKKHIEYTTIRVRSNIVAVDGNGNPTGLKLRETTFMNNRDGALRSWVTDETGKVLYSIERVENVASKSMKTPVVAAVLFDTNSVRMASVLKSVGIQIPHGKDANSTAENTGGDKMNLRRWNQTVAWVLGKEAQLWIEKDTFIPVRVIAPPRMDSQLYDFQMENFKYFDEYAYPRLGTLYQVGKKAPILKAELVDVILDPSLPASEFPKEKEGFTEAGQSASSQVRDLIETYYRLIR